MLDLKFPISKMHWQVVERVGHDDHKNHCDHDNYDDYDDYDTLSGG